jgi:anti-sigma regulatory factor (Ser/Thr protein kinase)
VRATRTLGNALAELPPILDWLEAALETAGVAAAIVGELRLIAEEGLSNVIRHGYADSARHSIEVTLEIGGGEIVLVGHPLAAEPGRPRRLSARRQCQCAAPRQALGIGSLLYNRSYSDAKRRRAKCP